MRICYVTHLYFPDGGGDVFGHHAMARALVEQGNQVDVVTWAFRRRKGQRQSLDGVNVARLRGVNLRALPTIKEYPLLFGVETAISSSSPDVVNCHSHLFPSSLEGIRASRSLGIPVVVTIHGVTAKRDPLTNLAQKGYLLSVCRVFLARADCIVCLTEHDRRTIESIGLRNKIEVIPNGVDLALFHPAEEKSMRTIAWAGRMVPEKGLDHLLMAVSEVAKVVPDLKLQLVGTGPEMPRLKELAIALGIGPNCVFMGLKSQDEVARILSRSSVFVLPSLSEGMPRALLEAMACSNAVVASDLPQTREVVDDGKTGLLGDPRDRKALVKNLTDCVLDASLARRLGTGSRRRCEEKYNLKTVAVEYQRMYQSIIHEKAGNNAVR